MVEILKAPGLIEIGIEKLLKLSFKNSASNDYRMKMAVRISNRIRKSLSFVASLILYIRRGDSDPSKYGMISEWECMPRDCDA